MNKESEVLETSVLLKFLDDWLKRYDVCNIDYNFYKIKEALQRLEEIDNADPSEALECLNCLERLHDCGVFNYEEMEDYNIIKNYILKAQEPKHYLKWEDLKTNADGGVDLEVSLNGTKYMLSYFPSDTFKVLTNDEDFYLEIEDKQFFNDLHLEVVE